MKTNEKIFKDIQRWLFENHEHYYSPPLECPNEREGDPFIFSLDFENWLREYLQVPKKVLRKLWGK